MSVLEAALKAVVRSAVLGVVLHRTCCGTCASYTLQRMHFCDVFMALVVCDLIGQSLDWLHGCGEPNYSLTTEATDFSYMKMLR